jgi:hypothetical protein
LAQRLRDDEFREEYERVLNRLASWSFQRDHFLYEDVLRLREAFLGEEVPDA